MMIVPAEPRACLTQHAQTQIQPMPNSEPPQNPLSFTTGLSPLKIRGTLFWGPYNKDPTIWGTILGSPYFQNPPFVQAAGLLGVFGALPTPGLPKRASLGKARFHLPLVSREWKNGSNSSYNRYNSYSSYSSYFLL